MLGLMQSTPLTIESILRRAETYFGQRTVTTALSTAGQPSGSADRQRLTYTELGEHIRRVSGVLAELKVSAGARVGSFAWNTADHLALYFAVPCTGRVLHTINLRLFAEQLRYTVEHAQDEVIFCDRSLLPLLAPQLPFLACVQAVIVFEDAGFGEASSAASKKDPYEEDQGADPRIVSWQQLTADPLDFAGTVTDENTAAALCYTTGTTGNPKGVLYSHRSTWLHALNSQLPSTFGLTDRDTVMPVVPMFHAMAWGLPFAGLMAGANLVLPGADLRPASLLQLIQDESVTVAAGVPSIWLPMTELLPGRSLPNLRTVICGGSAVPQALSEAWRAAIGLPITQAWGMTELSPMGAVCTLRPEFDDLSEAGRATVRATAGLAPAGLEMRIVDTLTREPLPWDDEATGELECRGPWVASRYYRTDEPGEQFAPDGWLRTGDVAAISALGYLRLVDRTKDLIKSGGEWISSVSLENEIMAHPEVSEAAVIALPHPRWMERPFACVVLRPDSTLTASQLIDHLQARVPKWWLPDDIAFLAELPKTSVGKFSKRDLRAQFADRVLLDHPSHQE